MRGEYSTRQKALILNYINENSAHLTVADIVSGLELQGIHIGKATVYRTLERLCESGDARKFIIDERSGACYQYADSGCERHFHLKCIRCGELIHLSCDFLAEMEEHIFHDHGFKVSSGKTVIYGVCSHCSDANDVENCQCERPNSGCKK